jgi:hypothetical protein
MHYHAGLLSGYALKEVFFFHAEDAEKQCSIEAGSLVASQEQVSPLHRCDEQLRSDPSSHSHPEGAVVLVPDNGQARERGHGFA